MYSRLEAFAGDDVDLMCNASLTSKMMWTYDTDDGYVDYIYWNGRTVNQSRLHVSTTSLASVSHTLIISGAKLNDTGPYDCYDGNGLRRVGYQLIIVGM